MTQPDASVSCGLCGRVEVTPHGWPICEECFYSGRYADWLRDELAKEQEPARRHELEKALQFMTRPQRERMTMAGGK